MEILKLDEDFNLIIDNKGIIKIYNNYEKNTTNKKIGQIQESGKIISEYEQHQIRKLLLDKKQNIKFITSSGEKYYNKFLNYWKKDNSEKSIVIRDLIFNNSTTMKEAIFGLSFFLKDEFCCLSFNEIKLYIKTFKETLAAMEINDTVDFGIEIFNKSLEYLFPINISYEQRSSLLNSK